MEKKKSNQINKKQNNNFYFLFISSFIFGKLFLFISGDLSGIYDGLNKCGYLLLVNLGEHLTTLDPQGAAGEHLTTLDPQGAAGEHLTTLDLGSERTGFALRLLTSLKDSPQGAAGATILATLESQDTACDFTYEGL